MAAVTLEQSFEGHAEMQEGCLAETHTWDAQQPEQVMGACCKLAGGLLYKGGYKEIRLESQDYSGSRRTVDTKLRTKDFML